MIKKTNNVLVLVATHFEDVELITTIDILSRAKIKYHLVSVENLWEVGGKYNAFVKTTPLNEIDVKQFNALFLPGGPGVDILLKTTQVLEIVKDFSEKNFLIAAICAAPEVLVQADVIGDKIITAFPNFAQIKNNSNQNLEISDNLITARDFEVTLPFAKAIVSYLNN